MESPVEGLNTPDFIESECSINIQGVKWNEPIPSSVTPRPISTRSMEKVTRNVFSEISSTLKGNDEFNPLLSRDNLKDDVAKRAYKQSSSVRVKSRASCSKNEQRTNKEDGRGLPASDQDSVAHAADSKSPAVNAAITLSSEKRQKIPESQNGIILDNFYRTDHTDDMSIMRKDTETARGSNHKSNFLHIRDSLESCTSSANFNRTPSPMLDTAFVLKYDKENRDIRAPSGDGGDSMLSRLISTCLDVKTNSQSVEDYQIFHNSKRNGKSNIDNLVKILESKSTCLTTASKPRPERLMSELTVNGPPEEAECGITAKGSTSSTSVLAFVESRLNKGIYTSPHSFTQTSSSAMQCFQTTSRSSEIRNSGEDKNISSYADFLKHDVEKSYHSSPMAHVKEGNSNSALCESLAQERKAEAKYKSTTPGKETPTSLLASTGNSSGYVSRIPVRVYTPKVKEPANDQSKKKAEKNKKQKRKDRSSDVIRRNSKTGPHKESIARVDMKKTHEKDEANTKITALERRRAYEAKRKLDQKEALAAKKSEKISKRQNTNSSLRVPCINNDTPATRKKSKRTPTMNTNTHTTRESPNPPFSVDTETDGIEGKMKQFLFVNSEALATERPENRVIEVGDYRYEDAFEPIDEDAISRRKSVDNTSQIPNAESQTSRVQKECAHHVHKANISPVNGGHRKEKSNHCNIMTHKDINDTYQEMAFGGCVVQSNNDYPSTAKSTVDVGTGSLASSKLDQERPYCFRYMHPDLAREYENLNRIPKYSKLKKDEIGMDCRMNQSSYDIAINRYLKSKPRNTTKKVTVGYIPEYGAVPVMGEHTYRARPVEEGQNSYVASSNDVTENRPRPGRSKREIVGFVPGYGSVRRAPIKVKPEVPSEKVFLPPINVGGVCNSRGDVSESKKSPGKKRNKNVSDSRTGTKPFNACMDAKAPGIFERGYTRRQF